MNPRRRPRKAIIAYLENRFGRNSEVLIDRLDRISAGKKVDVETDLPGVVKTLTPTISEMLDATTTLLAYQHGRPSQTVEVDVDDRREKWAPERLTLQELQEMDRLARKASLPAGTIDADFEVKK